MTAYARIVEDHPRAADLARSLAGRYRFTITPGGGLDVTEAYDLVVAPGPDVGAEVAGAQPTALSVSADYGRWKGLLTGEADFMRSLLLRRIKVHGDVGQLRSRIRDAKPLLDCLGQVPTDFRA